jgi:hypothetical protein
LFVLCLFNYLTHGLLTCIVMKILLPPGVNPTAVKYIYQYIIKYKVVSDCIMCIFYIIFYLYDLFIYFLWLCSPARAMASLFMRFLDHTQRRSTIGRTPLDE